MPLIRHLYKKNISEDLIYILSLWTRVPHLKYMHLMASELAPHYISSNFWLTCGYKSTITSMSLSLSPTNWSCSSFVFHLICLSISHNFMVEVIVSVLWPLLSQTVFPKLLNWYRRMNDTSESLRSLNQCLVDIGETKVGKRT